MENITKLSCEEKNEIYKHSLEHISKIPLGKYVMFIVYISKDFNCINPKIKICSINELRFVLGLYDLPVDILSVEPSSIEAVVNGSLINSVEEIVNNIKTLYNPVISEYKICFN